VNGVRRRLGRLRHRRRIVGEQLAAGLAAAGATALALIPLHLRGDAYLAALGLGAGVIGSFLGVRAARRDRRRLADLIANAPSSSDALREYEEPWVRAIEATRSRSDAVLAAIFAFDRTRAEPGPEDER
jgi:hypothetical protein